MKKIYIGILFISIAVVFLFFFSTSTTPLLQFSIEGDSATFQTIGKYWVRGRIPYRDLWDHKGPVIFFINAVGYWMTDSKVGIFLIQIVSMIITEFLAFKIYRIKFSSKTAVLFTTITILSLAMNYSEGNGTEEYALPLLMTSFFFMLKWCVNLKNQTIEHCPKWAMLYGVCVSFCLMTRVTNAVGVCVGIVFITVYLMIKKKWLNLIQNATMFIAGFLLLLIPFVFYFALNGALSEMWYGTLGYNLQYAKQSGFQWKQSMKENLEVILGLFNSIALCFTGICIIFFDKKRRVVGAFWSLISIGTLIWLIKGYCYFHYGIIALPYLVISIVEMYTIQMESKWKIIRNAAFLCISGFLLVSVVSGVFRIKNLAGIYDYYIERADDITIFERIPKDEKNSFVAYNTMNNLYLEMDSCPYYSYFILQDWQGKHSSELRTKIYETYSAGDVKWILVVEYTDGCGIQKILDENYRCVDKEIDPFLDNEYRLYCRIEE